MDRVRSFVLAVVALAFLAGAAAPVLARDHFVAPRTTAANDGAPPDGTAAAPWPSARAALASDRVAGGDRIVLLPGSHGHIDVVTDTFDPPVVVEPADPSAVHVDRITVRRGAGLTFRDLRVWPTDPAVTGRHAHVETTDRTARIRFENLDIRSVVDAPDRYLSWDRQDWRSGPARRNAVRIAGPDSALTGSRVTGVNFGVTVRRSALRAEIRGNHVLGFAGDAYRALSNDSIFAENRAENCVKVNDNHDDAFQSWSPRIAVEGAANDVRNVTIERNVVLEWTAAPHPLRCRLHGVGLFDGPYRNFVIRNNAIVVSAFHGIALYNVQDSTIVNNSVVHADGKVGGNPWIMLNEKSTSEATLSRDNVVAGNIAHSYRVETVRPQPVDRTENALIGSAARQFPGLDRGDLSLPADSPFLDRAPPHTAPSHDLTGTPRPQGSGPDFGANERVGARDPF